MRGAGKAESNGSLLPLPGGVAQMHFKHRARQHGTEEITGKEWRPGAQPHADGRVSLEFQIRDRIMAPIMNLLGRVHPLQGKSFWRRLEGNIALGVAPLFPNAEFMACIWILVFTPSFLHLFRIAQDPRLPPYA